MQVVPLADFMALADKVEVLTRRIAAMESQPLALVEVSVEQACEMLGKSDSTIRRMVRDRRLPHRMEGTSVRIPTEAIRARQKFN